MKIINTVKMLILVVILLTACGREREGVFATEEALSCEEQGGQPIMIGGNPQCQVSGLWCRMPGEKEPCYFSDLD
jgi:hypothetical protein